LVPDIVRHAFSSPPRQRNNGSTFRFILGRLDFERRHSGNVTQAPEVPEKYGHPATAS
jgi:hypothetical protein